MRFIIEKNVLTKFIYDENHDSNETILSIPDGVEKIAKGADDELILRQYRKLVLPNSLKTIEEGAMLQLRMLESISLSDESPLHFLNGCLYSSDMKNLIVSTNGINHIDIAEGCEKIYACAFLMRNNLMSINMPNTIISIGERCFLSCYELNKISLSERLNKIPLGAFVNCCKLSELYIPNSIKIIENDAIAQTTKLIFHAGSIAENYAISNSMNFTKLLY